MAHRRISHAIGSNHYKPWEAFDDADKYRSLERALTSAAAAPEAASVASAVEQALIEARYPARVDVSTETFCFRQLEKVA